MSFALHVYLHDLPTVQAIEVGFEKQKLLIEKSGDSDPPEIHAMFDSENSAFSVLGPYQVSQDDIPDIESPELRNSKWLLFLSTGFCDDRGIEAAQEFCEYLISRYRGVVYDPQEDCVVFPELATRASEPNQTRLLTLQWFCDESSFLPNNAMRLLKCIKDNFAECLPKRFGTASPLQDELIDGKEKRFIEVCQREQESGLGIVFWNSRSIGIGGAIHLPSAYGVKLGNERPCVSIVINFDCAEISSSSAEKVMSLFTEVASQLECFYAAAYVTRNVVVRGREIFFDSESERIDFGRNTLWSGIPDVRTWLTWFGDPDIRSKVSRHLDPLRLSFDGRFMKFGDHPLDADELQDIFPKLPDSVLNLDSGDWVKQPFGKGRK